MTLVRSKRRAALAALLAGAALTAAGCGGGETKTVVQTVTATTSETVAQPETTTATDDPGALARAALLVLDDFPDGWSGDGEAYEAAFGAEESEACLPTPPDGAAMSSPLFINDKGEQVSNNVGIFRSGSAAQRVVAALASPESGARDCLATAYEEGVRYSFAGPIADGEFELGAVTAERSGVAAYGGDDSAGVRICVPVTGGSTVGGRQPPMCAAVIVIRVGTAVISSTISVSPSRLDPRIASELLSASVERVRELTQSAERLRDVIR